MAAWYRLLYVAIAGAAVLHRLLAAKLVDSTGYTVKSDYASRALGILVTLAGLGYVVSSLVGVLLADFNRNVAVLPLAVVTVPGEFGLTGWLLWRAGRHGSPVQSGLAEHPV